MAGPLVPYNHVRPKRGLIHRDRKSSVIRPLLYLQATTAGCHTTKPVGGQTKVKTNPQIVK